MWSPLFDLDAAVARVAPFPYCSSASNDPHRRHSRVSISLSGISGTLGRNLKLTSFLSTPVIFAAAQTTNLPHASLCVLITKNRERRTQHAAYAVDYYRAAYPNVNFTVQPVGVYEAAGTTPQGLGRALINHDTAGSGGCTAVIGPGSSALSQSINVLVQSLWMCYSATSTQLSDKTLYTYFSRVIPSDAASTVGAARLMIDFGWRQINSFCTDNSYGQSVMQGVAESFTTLGGSVGVTRCVSSAASNASIIAALDAFAQAESKVVFAAVSTSDLFYRSFIDIVVRNGYDKRLIFFFSESSCSAGVHTYAAIEGSLCATFRIDQRVFGAFYESYLARNTAVTDQWFLDAGYPAAFPIDKTGTEVFAAYAVDATRFIMQSLDAYTRSVGAAQAAVDFTDSAKMIDVVVFARKQAMLNGVTGPNVTLNANGDRPSSDMVVYNGQPGGVARVVANITGDSVSVASEIYWLASGFLTTPPRATPLPPPASNTVTVVAAASAGGALFLIVVIIVVGLVLFSVFRPKVRDTSRAPTDGDNVTIAFTDIEKSTLLWSLHPMEMATALDHHHRLIRESIQKYEGYEVKTIGDSFMVAFRSPTHGMLFALDIQDRLFEFDWGTDVFDTTYKEKLEYDAEVLKTYSAHWNGVRVRVGVHTGSASVDFDEVARGYDYYGPAVNCAARIESLAHGGQVLLSDAARTKAQESPVCPQWAGKHKWTEVIDFKAMGEHEVRGIPEPVAVHQVHFGMERYWGRTFPPVRSDHHPPQEEEEEPQDATTGQLFSETGLDDPEMISLDGSAASGARPYMPLTRTYSQSSKQSAAPMSPGTAKINGSPAAPKPFDLMTPGGARRLSATGGHSAFDVAYSTAGTAQMQHAALVAAYRQLPPKAVRHIRSKRSGRLNYAGKILFAEMAASMTSVLSILKEKEKIDLVQRLCKAWRVPYDPSVKIRAPGEGGTPVMVGSQSKYTRGSSRSHKVQSGSDTADNGKDKTKVFTAYAEPQLYVLLQKLTRMRLAKMTDQAAAVRKRTGRSSSAFTPVVLLGGGGDQRLSQVSQGDSPRDTTVFAMPSQPAGDVQQQQDQGHGSGLSIAIPSIVTAPAEGGILSRPPE